MVKVWRTSKPFSIIDICPYISLVKFENQGDKHKVLLGRPWLFDNFLFSLKQFDGRVPPAKMDFSKEVFWVNMHNLPLACMNEAKGTSIDNTIGTVIECDVDEEGTSWGKALRVLIEIDIFQSVPRGRIINVEGVAFWIPLTFKNLLRIYFKC